MRNDEIIFNLPQLGTKWLGLKKGDKGSLRKNPLPDRKALDDIVFDALGLTEQERKEVYWVGANNHSHIVKNKIRKSKECVMSMVRKKNSFGGDWTEEKLEALKKYLNAYLTIMKGNEKARYYKIIYIDAFAGPGYRAVDTEEKGYLAVFFEEETRKFLDGSPRIALQSMYNKTGETFDEFIFIELDKGKCEELENLKKEFSHIKDRTKIVNEDANSYLQKLCRITDWSKKRALVFLDPYGMQVEWKTLEMIAKTKAIDCWILFPLGVAVNRLLKRDGNIDNKRRERLNKLFGTEEWYNEFYKVSKKETLFGPETNVEKVPITKIGNYFCKRLKEIFYAVSEPRALYNSKRNPIYLLIFACANEKASKTALKIANDILKKLG
ncbi:MAG: three-Cys-motif partner protein TcmP [Bacteroidota bacterium]